MIEPPDTDATFVTLRCSPISTRPMSTPSEKSAARTPPPDSATPVDSSVGTVPACSARGAERGGCPFKSDATVSMAASIHSVGGAPVVIGRNSMQKGVEQCSADTWNDKTSCGPPPTGSHIRGRSARRAAKSDAVLVQCRLDRPRPAVGGGLRVRARIELVANDRVDDDSVEHVVRSGVEAEG